MGLIIIQLDWSEMDSSSGTSLKIQFQIVSDEENQNIFFKVSPPARESGTSFKFRSWNSRDCILIHQESVN